MTTAGWRISPASPPGTGSGRPRPDTALAVPGGPEGDWPPVGLSPRKTALTLYLSTGFGGAADLLARLGPHSVGKICLYLQRLSDVDQSVLRELVRRAFAHLNGRTITA